MLVRTHLLYSVHQPKCYPLPETPSQTYLEITAHPLAHQLIYKIIHHTWNFILSPAWRLAVRPCPGLELRVDANFTGF